MPVLLLDQIQQGQHCLFAGMNGSGKTTLAERLMSSLDFAICIDTKHELNWVGFTITADLDDAFAIAKPPKGEQPRQHAIYRPAHGPRGLANVEKLYARAYEEWGWTVYADEIYALAIPGRTGPTAYPTSYVRGLTAGRSRGVSIWTGAQRPKYFPVFATTESTHFFVFELGSEDDRKDLYRMVGLDALNVSTQQTLGPHEFLYYSRLQKTAVRSKLTLGR